MPRSLTFNTLDKHTYYPNMLPPHSRRHPTTHPHPTPNSTTRFTQPAIARRQGPGQQVHESEVCLKRNLCRAFTQRHFCRLPKQCGLILACYGPGRGVNALHARCMSGADRCVIVLEREEGGSDEGGEPVWMGEHVDFGTIVVVTRGMRILRIWIDHQDAPQQLIHRPN